MEHCSKCHAKVGVQYLFCEECGADLRKKIIQKSKIKVIKKIEKKEIENLKKQLGDTKKEFERELDSIKERDSNLKEKLRKLECEKEIKKPGITREVNEKIDVLKKQIEEFKINFDVKLNQLKKSSKEEIQGVNQKEERLEEKERKEEQKVSNTFKSIIGSINQKFEGIKKKFEEKPKKKKIIKPKTRGKRSFPVKFKLSKLNLMKNIKKLKKPEFVK